GVPAQPLRGPRAQDHRGAPGILGHCRRDRAHRRYHRSALPLLIVPPYLIFAIARAQVAADCNGSGTGMIGRQQGGKIRSTTGRRPGWVSGSAAVCMVGVAFAALAQDARPLLQSPPESPAAPAIDQPAAPAPAAPSAPLEAFKPGFIDAFGRWLEQGAAKLRSDMQDAQDKFDKFGNQPRDPAKE